MITIYVFHYFWFNSTCMLNLRDSEVLFWLTGFDCAIYCWLLQSQILNPFFFLFRDNQHNSWTAEGVIFLSVMFLILCFWCCWRSPGIYQVKQLKKTIQIPSDITFKIKAMLKRIRNNMTASTASHALQMFSCLRSMIFKSN